MSPERYEELLDEILPDLTAEQERMMTDDLDELLDRKYREGQHALAQSMLQHVAMFLKREDRDLASLLRELDASREIIRRVCELAGDTDWDEHLWLPDVLDKHLLRHLED